jgi:hypothetical protein
MKLMTLIHELGHVQDMERSINFDHVAKRCDMIEAEVYAHLYSLERMARMNYSQCFDMLMDALKRAVGGDGYLSEVATLVLQRAPTYRLVDVVNIPLEPLTASDIKALGSDGLRAVRKMMEGK